MEGGGRLAPSLFFFVLMRIEVTGNPGTNANIITVADLKAHLRVMHTAEDDLIEALRDAAIAYVEGYCNTKLQNLAATAWMYSFKREVFPVGPVTEIESVKYQTSSSTEEADLTTLPTANWYATTATQPALIEFINPPVPYDYAHFPIRVSFKYGYSNVPEPIVHAVRLLTAHLYENRQQVVDRNSVQIQLGVHAMLAQYRNIVQP